MDKITGRIFMELFLDICKNDYRAVFQMLREAIDLCPDSLWDERLDEPPFWHQVCHTIFFVDFYLSDSPEKCQSPSFVKPELDQTPPATPSQQQIKDYLEEVSKKCEVRLNNLTLEQLKGKNTFPWTGPTLAHRLSYNIRHAQHHVGWLNSMLRRKAGQAAKWVITVKIN
ncbi:MAG: DinB family protein [Candidatus Hodarchaeota archaeon]